MAEYRSPTSSQIIRVPLSHLALPKLFSPFGEARHTAQEEGYF